MHCTTAVRVAEATQRANDGFARRPCRARPLPGCLPYRALLDSSFSSAVSRLLCSPRGSKQLSASVEVADLTLANCSCSSSVGSWCCADQPSMSTDCRLQPPVKCALESPFGCNVPACTAKAIGMDQSMLSSPCAPVRCQARRLHAQNAGERRSSSAGSW